MHKSLHHRDNVDSMCQEKKEGEHLPALKISVHTSTRIKKRRGRQITTTRNNTDNTNMNRKQKWEIVWFRCDLWDINPCGLFNAKSCVYIYISEEF